MATLRSGIIERIPYSLSRWTDVPAAKWPWFKAQIAAGQMIAIDPRNAVPYRWSLRPEDTLGLVFWTKDPQNLVFDAPWLKNYRYKVHVTATGWEEVEKGVGTIGQQQARLYAAITTLGPENVVWRFSPVPIVPDAVRRFAAFLGVASEAGLDRVYISFLQQNDLIPETRDETDRLNLLVQMAELAGKRNVRVLLCNEDRLLASHPELHPFLGSGICAPPEDFDLPDQKKAPSEGCGCVLMADPFTINESCTFGCQYCYAADKTLLPKKLNTTPARRLPVVR